MKLTRVILCTTMLISCLCSCATLQNYKPDPWTTDQILLQTASTTLGIIDWGTTLDIASNPDEYWEINPVLGKHPSRGEVNRYFAASVLSKILITHLLPSKYRKWWLGLNIGISGYMVKNNYKIGLKMDF